MDNRAAGILAVEVDKPAADKVAAAEGKAAVGSLVAADKPAVDSCPAADKSAVAE